jgi:hypothetical protein
MRKRERESGRAGERENWQNLLIPRSPALPLSLPESYGFVGSFCCAIAFFTLDSICLTCSASCASGWALR